MQLLVRGCESTYVLEASSLEQLKAQVFEAESSEECLLYIAGKTIEMLNTWMTSDLSNSVLSELVSASTIALSLSIIFRA